MKKSGTIGLLDTILILFAACTLLLFFFWAGATLANKGNLFEVLPDWMRSLTSTLWTFIVTSLIAVVRAYINRQLQGSGHPNYLLWITGMSFVFGGAILAIYALMRDEKTTDFVDMTISVYSQTDSTLLRNANGKVTIQFAGKPVDKNLENGTARFNDREILAEDTVHKITIWVNYPGYITRSYESKYRKFIKVYLSPKTAKPIDTLRGFKISGPSATALAKLIVRNGSGFIQEQNGKDLISITFTGNLQKSVEENLFWYPGGKILVLVNEEHCYELSNPQIAATHKLGAQKNEVLEIIESDIARILDNDESIKVVLANEILKCLESYH